MVGRLGTGGANRSINKQTAALVKFLKKDENTFLT